jgi:cobalamin biosynthesis protein CobT
MKTARVQLIESTTEKVSRILAENYGIQAVFKGDLCCTDGKRVFLPVIGDGASEEFLASIPGMVDHESSHILHSDFTLQKEIKKAKTPKKLMIMTNVCEDARIELAMVKKWRGCRNNFEKLSDFACKKLVDKWDQLSEWGKIVQMCGGVAGLGLDNWFTKEVSQLEPELWSHVEKVIPLLQKSKDTKSSREAMELAQQILDVLHEHEEPKEEEKGDGDEANFAGGTGKAQPGDAEDSPSNDPADQDADEGDDPQEGDDDGSVEKRPDCLNEDFDPTDEQGENDAAVTDRQKMISEEARKTQQHQPHGTYMIYSTERDVIDTIDKGDHQAAHKLLDESRQITNVMRMKMMRNLLAQNRARRDPGKERGKIDRRSLFRVSLETSKRVFWQRVEAPEFNTRASLWVDHSGSMQGQKLRLAAASAMLFGEVLDALKIPFEVCGFSTSTTGYEGTRIYDSASAADRKIFTRWGGLWVGVYKSFDESWHAVKHRCSTMERHQHDNTYDGECLRLAAQRLLEYPEPRRVLFWFNDGEPCPNVSDFMADHQLYLKRVVKEVEKVIEVFAVGIMTDNVKQYYSNSVVINNLQDLPKVMLGELDRLLRKNQQVHLGASL